MRRSIPKALHKASRTNLGNLSSIHSSLRPGGGRHNFAATRVGALDARAYTVLRRLFLHCSAGVAICLRSERVEGVVDGWGPRLEYPHGPIHHCQSRGAHSGFVLVLKTGCALVRMGMAERSVVCGVVCRGRPEGDRAVRRGPHFDLRHAAGPLRNLAWIKRVAGSIRHVPGGGKLHDPLSFAPAPVYTATWARPPVVDRSRTP